MSANILLPILTFGGLATCVALLLWESGQWVAFDGAAGHRPGRLLRTAETLRRAGIRTRVQNTVTVGSEAAVGAGMSTTLLVHKGDIGKARRVAREARGTEAMLPK